MKQLLIGDPHFKTNNRDETDKFTKSTLEWLEENYSGLDRIVIMGDVLDTHEKIHLKPLMRATEFIFNLSQYADVIVLIGNHDRPSNDTFLTDEHSLYPLKYMAGAADINIIDKGWWDKKNGFVYVPYVETGRFMEALRHIGVTTNDLEGKEIKAIFAHQEFVGAQLGGIVSIAGDGWSKEYPPIYSGHIHQYQVLEHGVTYIGTPYQTGFSVCDIPNHGIYLLEDAKLTKIGLNVKPKVLRHVKIEEVLEFKFDDELYEKLIIQGNVKEIRNILKNKEYKQKLKDREYTLKEVREIQLPTGLKGGELVTVPKIVELLKKETKDETELEILNDVFP